jgi:heme exporter protein A
MRALCYIGGRFQGEPGIMSQSFSGHDLTCIRGERVVFAGLGFEVAAGGALILTGPNGSGKSSLLRLMAGLLQPEAGEMRRDGADVADDPAVHRSSLHYVGHKDAVKPVLSAAENLAFWAAMRGAAGAIETSLDALGLERLADVPARFLSAGETRRLSLARLVASPAPLWLLDEPTVVLDARAVRLLAGLIARHRAEGGMVVAATHTELGLGDETRLELADFARPHQPALGAAAL